MNQLLAPQTLDSLMEVEPFRVPFCSRTTVRVGLAWRQASLPWMGACGAQFTPGAPLRRLLGMDGAESPGLFGEVTAGTTVLPARPSGTSSRTWGWRRCC